MFLAIVGDSYSEVKSESTGSEHQFELLNHIKQVSRLFIIFYIFIFYHFKPIMNNFFNYLGYT